MDVNKILKYILYDKDSGKLYWKEKKAQCSIISEEIGFTDAKGYKRVVFDGKSYFQHRLVWFIETGLWPKNQIDHKDKNKLNNRFSNLRDVSNYVNCLNRVNKNGLPYGVYFAKDRGKYRAEHNKKSLGSYTTWQEAALVYNEYIKRNIENGWYDPQFISMQELKKTYGKA